jgi:predicted ATP-dependent serine protease
MSRSLTTKNLFNKKQGKKIQLTNPKLAELIGNADAKGCWIIYGPEKNGKTWFTLRLARDIARNQKVAYISAEEGTDDSFILACKRAGVTASDKILIDEYMPLEDLIQKYRKPKSAEVIFIDNMTIYADDFKNLPLLDFLKQLPKKLIVFVAHEERKEPYPAIAKSAKRLSKVYISVKGLRAFVVSRFSSGGELDIDPDKAELYWGK